VLLRVQEDEDGVLSSGDAVATEGEEEEASPMRSLVAKDPEMHDSLQSVGGDAVEGEQLTPYVAKCYGHLETLRKRKREQEEQMETLVEGAGAVWLHLGRRS
jgi:hypothetical protein